MLSTEPGSRASKGSVRIKVSNGRLQLVFSYDGTRHYLSLGLPDNKINRKVAEAKAKIIESDIALERFDPTLAKYKPLSLKDSPVPDLLAAALRSRAPTVSAAPDLADLWERYTIFKKPQIGQSTFAVDYRKYRNHIAKLPTRDLRDAIAIRDHLIANLTPNAARRVLTNINACCNWAVESRLIEVNPFNGMASRINLPKGNREELDIRSFTRSERDAIIEAFENSEAYNYYSPLVKFLFFTGCRPSEAIALQWKHVSVDWRYLTFERSYTIGPDGTSIKDGLKTQASRKFPINERLKAMR